MILQWDNLNGPQREAIRIACEESFEGFLRIMFQLIQGQKFKKNWHHTYECQIAEQVYRGELNRVIVNVAPGSTKTEIWSIHWICWCIVQCIKKGFSSRWLPLSYSDELVIENSTRVKEILDSEEFQWMWPLRQSKSTNAKNNWLYFDANNNMHRLYGTSIGGQVTGRRAGYMIEKEFTGALILDDPLPPKEADSGKIMDKANKKLNRVVRSRLAHDEVPIVMVQQRIAKGDSTDFLMSDKTPDDYTLFKVPALIDREYIESLNQEMREACIRDTGFKGKKCSYWPSKEPTGTLIKMQKADNYMFSSQYQQNPDDALLEGVVYKKEIDLLIKEGRFCHIPIEPSLEVHTFWDLGLNDDMCVWLMQAHRFELRMIACYANRDEGMEHYINWLKDFEKEHGIRYGQHYAPHDISVRDLMTKQSRKATAKAMGINFTLVERTKSKRESIQALKKIFKRIFIDKTRCDTDISGNTGNLAHKTGWKALKTLRRDWDHDNEVFKDETGPKWATNFTDAIQQMGLHFKPKPPKDGSKGSGQGTGGGGWMRG